MPKKPRPKLEELAGQAGGIQCSKCDHNRFWTIRAEPHKKGFVLRRRECRQCGHRMTTGERVIGN